MSLEEEEEEGLECYGVGEDGFRGAFALGSAQRELTYLRCKVSRTKQAKVAAARRPLSEKLPSSLESRFRHARSNAYRLRVGDRDCASSKDCKKILQSEAILRYFCLHVGGCYGLEA